MASRELTCIQNPNIFHPHATYKSKTELCRDLMDPKAVSNATRIVIRCARRYCVRYVYFTVQEHRRIYVYIVDIETKPEPRNYCSPLRV